MADESSSSRAAKVQEAAANVKRATGGPRRRGRSDEAQVLARGYFEAINSHDLDAAVAHWAPGGREHVHGHLDVTAPEGVHAFLGSLLGAFPDLRMEVLSTVTEGEHCGVQWRLSGTFAGPAKLNGVAPTGDRVTLEGIDLLTIREGLIQSNEAFTDTLSFPRTIGMMPAGGSRAEQRLAGVFNVKTQLKSVGAGEAGMIATGVWVVQGQPGRCNVFLIEDDGGVTAFDAGARTMSRLIAIEAAKLGGIHRVVLGHGHTDHRGAAPALGVPVLCHPHEVQDAEGSGGFRYWPSDLAGLPTPQRQIHRLLHRIAWDGGPVEISQTLNEGDQIAGFEVIHIPGHAPGQIALWRESDRLALVSDCFYTLDMWGRSSEPHLPVDTYNFDTEQARKSLRKLAALEPAAAWPGHAKPVTGDVRAKLERAADS